MLELIYSAFQAVAVSVIAVAFWVGALRLLQWAEKQWLSFKWRNHK